MDQESGDATFATVVVEVLSEGQSSKDTLLHTGIHYWLLVMSLQSETMYLYVCLHYSPLQSTGRWASNKLHCGQSAVSEYGVHDHTWMYPVYCDVAEEETQGKERPTAERLCGPGQTPQCGEILHLYNPDLHLAKCVGQ